MSIETEIIKADIPRRTGLTWAQVAGVVCTFLVLGVYLWYQFKPVPAPVGVWTEAIESKIVADVPKETIQPKALKVYTKQAKTKQKLPDRILKDDNKVIVASSTVGYDLHPRTVTTIADKQTGEVETLTRVEPLPLIAAIKRGSAGLYYGYKSGMPALMVDQHDFKMWQGVAYGSQPGVAPTARVWRGTLNYDLVQTKAVYWGGMVNLDSDGEKFVGAGISVKW